MSDKQARNSGTVEKRTDGLTDWRTEELTDWRTDGLTDGLTDCAYSKTIYRKKSRSPMYTVQ